MLVHSREETWGIVEATSRAGCVCVFPNQEGPGSKTGELINIKRESRENVAVFPGMPFPAEGKKPQPQPHLSSGAGPLTEIHLRGHTQAPTLPWHGRASPSYHPPSSTTGRDAVRSRTSLNRRPCLLRAHKELTGFERALGASAHRAIISLVMVTRGERQSAAPLEAAVGGTRRHNRSCNVLYASKQPACLYVGGGRGGAEVKAWRC